MKPSVSRLGVAVTLGVLAVAALVGAWVFVPTLLYPNLDAGQISQIPDALSRVQSQQAQGALQNSVRSTLLQGAAGLLGRVSYVAGDGHGSASVACH